MYRKGIVSYLRDEVCNALRDKSHRDKARATRVGPVAAVDGRCERGHAGLGELGEQVVWVGAPEEVDLVAGELPVELLEGLAVKADLDSGGLHCTVRPDYKYI